MTRFEDLPDEMLTLVTEHLPFNGQKNLSLTGRRIRDVTLPLLFHTFKPENWLFDKLQEVESLPRKILRAFTCVELEIDMKIQSDPATPQSYRFLRGLLAQMQPKQLCIRIQLPSLRESDAAAMNVLASGELDHALHNNALADFLAVAPFAQLEFIIGQGRSSAEGHLADTLRILNRESVQRHLQILTSAGNPLVRIDLNSKEDGTLPDAALQALIDRQTSPPSVSLGNVWCTSLPAVVKNARFLRLQDGRSRQGWAAFAPLVRENAGSLRELVLNTQLPDAGNLFFHSSAWQLDPAVEARDPIVLPHLGRLRIEDDLSRFHFSGLSILKAPTLQYLDVTVAELPEQFTLTDAVAAFPSLRHLHIEIVDVTGIEVDLFIPLFEQRLHVPCTVTIAINDLHLELRGGDAAPAATALCAPIVQALTVRMRGDVDIARSLVDGHSHLDFRHVRICTFDLMCHTTLSDIARTRQWQRSMHMLEVAMPHLQELVMVADRIFPGGLVELANVLFHLDLPDLRVVRLDGYVPDVGDRPPTAYEKMCFGHIRDVCKKKGVELDVFWQV